MSTLQHVMALAMLCAHRAPSEGVAFTPVHACYLACVAMLDTILQWIWHLGVHMCSHHSTRMLSTAPTRSPDSLVLCMGRFQNALKYSACPLGGGGVAHPRTTQDTDEMCVALSGASYGGICLTAPTRSLLSWYCVAGRISMRIYKCGEPNVWF